MNLGFNASQRYHANTLAEFIKLIDDLRFEVEEYIVCVQEELDDELEDLVTPLGQIQTYLKQLHTDVEKGEHSFRNNKDLDYMPLVRNLKHVLPFYAMFEGLNSSHISGLSETK